MTLEKALLRGLSVMEIAAIVDLSPDTVQEVIKGTTHHACVERVAYMLKHFNGPTDLYMWIEPGGTRGVADHITPFRAFDPEDAERRVRELCEKNGEEFHGLVIKYPSNHFRTGAVSPLDKGGLF